MGDMGPFAQNEIPRRHGTTPRLKRHFCLSADEFRIEDGHKHQAPAFKCCPIESPRLDILPCVSLPCGGLLTARVEILVGT